MKYTVLFFILFVCSGGASTLYSHPKNITAALQSITTPKEISSAKMDKVLFKKYKEQAYVKYFLIKKMHKAFNSAISALRHNPKDPIAQFFAVRSAEVLLCMDKLVLETVVADRTILSENIIKIDRFLNSMLHEKPNCAMLYFLKGSTFFYYRKNFRAELPLYYFKKTIELDRSVGAAYAYFAFFYKRVPDYKVKNDPNYKLKITFLKHALKIDKRVYSAHYNIAYYDFCMEKDLKKLKKDVWKIVHLSPMSLHALNLYLEIERKLGREKEDTLREIRSLAKNDPYIFWGFARVFFSKGYSNDGLQYIEDALKVTSSSKIKVAMIYDSFNAVNFLYFKQRFIRFLQLANQPNNDYLKYVRAVLKFGYREYSLAAKLFIQLKSSKDKMIRKNRLYSFIASSYIKIDKQAIAIRYYKKALQYKKDDPIILFNLGLVYYGQKKYTLAKKYWNIILQDHPQSFIVPKINRFLYDLKN